MRKLSTSMLLISLSFVFGCKGPAGPPGAAGPPGSSGSGGGPPYVWVCTPANFNSGSSTNADVFIFNGSATSANVAVNLLNKSGTNLAGVAVPGAAPGTVYPGQSGATTVPVASANTLIVNYKTAEGSPASGGNILATIRVTSDQPIAVGYNIDFSGFHLSPCSFAAR